MAIKKRVSADITTGTTGGTGTGTAQVEVGLGAAYAKVLRVEFKGDDANVDNNNTLKLTDAEGRIIFGATALDAGTDDSTTKVTSQTQLVGGAASTVGVEFVPSYPAAKALENDATAGTVGAAGVVAKSPVTIDIAAGTDGDVQRVILFVEV